MLKTNILFHYKTKLYFIIVISISLGLIAPGTIASMNQPTPIFIDNTHEIDQRRINSQSSALQLSMDSNNLFITYELPDLHQSVISTPNGEFTQLTIPNTSYTNEPGKPQIPVYQVRLAVPSTQVSISVTAKHSLDTKNIGCIYPVQPPQPDHAMSKTTSIVFDTIFYTQDINYPESVAHIQDQGYIRDIPFIKLQINPIQYNPNENVITIYDTITIQISWSQNDPIYVDQDFTTSSFYPYYQSIFTNWQEFIDTTTTIPSTPHPLPEPLAGCDYLIITHPNFLSAAEKLATWKDQKGILTKVVDTKKTGSTAENIRTYIQHAYDTWTTKPAYLLFIGDVEYVPTNYLFIHPYHGSETATDLWYGTVAGDDHHPDMFIGRLSADTSQEAMLLVEKIIKYEQTPPAQSSFYSNISVAAYFQDNNPQDGYEDRRFVLTSEEIRDYLLPKSFDVQRIYYTHHDVNPTNYNDGYYANGEPLPPELLKPGFPWDGNHIDISAAINAGTLLLNHRDHGFTYGWGDPYYDITHIASLSNNDLLPIVFSINCCSGQFDTDENESFCEAFVRHETGGAVGVIGASRVSYSGYNDYLCRGFYDAIWPDFDPAFGSTNPLYSLGQVLNYGKTYMSNTWGSGSTYERITFEMFHYFGDPTMELWTAQPQNLLVTHPQSINSTEEIMVTVTDATSNPIQDALVCVSNERLYGRGFTDNNGIARFETLEIAAASPQPCTIQLDTSLVVTKHDYLPYITEIIASVNQLGDINADGKVTIADLVLLLIAWGPNPGHPADLNGNGVVNFQDLFIFIINW